MTIANYITCCRIILIPIFGVTAWMYGESVLEGAPQEHFRWIALLAFSISAIGDALDGHIARKFNQKTKLGAYLDPIADKFLLLTGVIVLSRVPWGADDWIIPAWFAWMVIIRDLSIGSAVAIIYFFNKKVLIQVNKASKINTIVQLFTFGWVMLKWVPFSPLYPSLVCAVMVLISSYVYVLETCKQLFYTPSDSQ